MRLDFIELDLANGEAVDLTDEACDNASVVRVHLVIIMTTIPSSVITWTEPLVYERRASPAGPFTGRRAYCSEHPRRSLGRCSVPDPALRPESPDRVAACGRRHAACRDDR